MTETDLNLTLDQRSAVPLYEQICQQIRRKIESRQLEPGAQLPTNHELRARLQVNYKTAQQAMATLAREGYVTRQARRGTIVRGVPRRGVVGIYSHIDLTSQDDTHEYYRLITGYLSRQLEEKGRVHRLYLGSLSPDTPNTACEDLLRHLEGGTLCGAVLVNSPSMLLRELIELGRSRHVPVVALSGDADVEYSVRVDFRGYVRQAAEYLLRQGRSRVGLIYNQNSVGFREEGVAAAILQQCGLTPRTSWVVGWKETEEGGYEAAAQMPIAELDGLIIEDDVMAMGVDRRLREMKVNVPGDLMVTTFWNQGSRMRLGLPFERFQMDVKKQAQLGLQLMQDAINGRRISEPHLMILPQHVGT